MQLQIAQTTINQRANTITCHASAVGLTGTETTILVSGWLRNHIFHFDSTDRCGNIRYIPARRFLRYTLIVKMPQEAQTSPQSLEVATSGTNCHENN